MADPGSHDPFDSLLGLEDEYYREGYDLGVADGSRAGRTEGRIFGLEKGFEKFAAMGNLAGRNAVWEARVPGAGGAAGAAAAVADPRLKLPALPGNARLQKHLQTLYALVEADSLSTENNEDSVSDFDDRLKRAEGKVKVVEKLIGEGPLALDAPRPASSGTGASQERRQIRVKRADAGGDSNMEDFNIRHARS